MFVIIKKIIYLLLWNMLISIIVIVSNIFLSYVIVLTQTQSVANIFYIICVFFNSRLKIIFTLIMINTISDYIPKILSTIIVHYVNINIYAMYYILQITKQHNIDMSAIIIPKINNNNNIKIFYLYLKETIPHCFTFWKMLFITLMYENIYAAVYGLAQYCYLTDNILNTPNLNSTFSECDNTNIQIKYLFLSIIIFLISNI